MKRLATIFICCNDDDEISPNFVSELVYQLELHPEATLAYARLEIINKAGSDLRKIDRKPAQSILSGPDFIRATWQRYEFKYYNLEGFLARTKDLGGMRRLPGIHPRLSHGQRRCDQTLPGTPGCIQREVRLSPSSPSRRREPRLQAQRNWRPRAGNSCDG